MTLWRKARTEAAGAWRSVRYDLSRPAPRPGVPAPGRGAGHPDVTSTGLSTFGGADRPGGLRTSYGDPLATRPRRLAAASAFGVLAVAGAAGSYFAVVNGFGTLAGVEPAGAEPYPMAAEAPRGSGGGMVNSGLGRGTAHAVGRPPAPGTPAQAAPGTPAQAAPAAPDRIRVLPATTGAMAPVPPPVIVPRPQQTTVGAEPEGPPATTCCLAPPPVPTPTAPVPTPHSPTPHSPSATPSPTASSPDDGESPEPGESPTSEAPVTPDDEASTDHRRDRTRHARPH